MRRIPWLISRLVANERKYLRRYDVPLPTAVSLWRKGYFSYSAVLYDLDRLDLYLSDIDQHETKQIDGAMGNALRNKYICKRLLEQNYAANLPQTLGLVRKGRYHAECGPHSFLGAIEDSAGVVCKPIASGRGKGVHVIEPGEPYQFDGDPTTRDHLTTYESTLDEYLVEPQIDQHRFQATVFPDALNTMRILTMVDPDTGEPFLAATVHRFGVPSSAPTDNWSRGGIVAEIDRESGVLTPAVVASGKAKRRLERHPTTDTQIAGETVPSWSTVRELVLSIAQEFRTCFPYVGWDVAIAADGTPLIVEANRATDVDLLQLNEPLLADERCRRFYEYHDII